MKILMGRLKMTIVRRLKILNSQLSRKKPFPYWNRAFGQYLPTILFGSITATYLDLYFTGKKVYSFPIRPFPEIFSINILFTLVGIPIFILCFLFVVKKMSIYMKTGLLFVLSLFAAIFEKSAEKWGFFLHTNDWNHYYTIVGYFFYLTFLLFFFWLTRKEQ